MQVALAAAAAAAGAVGAGAAIALMIARPKRRLKHEFLHGFQGKEEK